MDTTLTISIIVILALALLLALLLSGTSAAVNPRPARDKSVQEKEPAPKSESKSEYEPASEPESEPVSEPESEPEPVTELNTSPDPEAAVEMIETVPAEELVFESGSEEDVTVAAEPEVEYKPEPEPEPDLAIKCEVLSNRNVGKYYKELRIRIPQGRDFRFRSGEYVHIYAPAGTVNFSDMEIDKRFQWDWKDEGLFSLRMDNPEELSREYTILSYPGEREEGEDGSTVIKFLVRLALPETEGVNPGVCSSYIFSLKPGDKVRISGPYGESLMLKDVPHEREFVFISGGAGISMMRSYVFSLLKGDKSTRKICCYYGTDVYSNAFYINEFRALEREFPSFRFRLVLEEPDMEAIMNGVDFDQGFVHQAVYENYLKKHKSPQLPLYFVCGPADMVVATRNMLTSLDIPAENIIGDGISDED